VCAPGIPTRPARPVSLLRCAQTRARGHYWVRSRASQRPRAIPGGSSVQQGRGGHRAQEGEQGLMRTDGADLSPASPCDGPLRIGQQGQETGPLDCFLEGALMPGAVARTLAAEHPTFPGHQLAQSLHVLVIHVGFFAAKATTLASRLESGCPSCGHGAMHLLRPIGSCGRRPGARAGHASQPRTQTPFKANRGGGKSQMDACRRARARGARAPGGAGRASRQRGVPPLRPAPPGAPWNFRRPQHGSHPLGARDGTVGFA